MKKNLYKPFVKQFLNALRECKGGPEMGLAITNVSPPIEEEFNGFGVAYYAGLFIPLAIIRTRTIAMPELYKGDDCPSPLYRYMLGHEAQHCVEFGSDEFRTLKVMNNMISDIDFEIRADEAGISKLNREEIKELNKFFIRPVYKGVIKLLKMYERISKGIVIRGICLMAMILSNWTFRDIFNMSDVDKSVNNAISCLSDIKTRYERVLSS